MFCTNGGGPTLGVRNPCFLYRRLHEAIEDSSLLTIRTGAKLKEFTSIVVCFFQDGQQGMRLDRRPQLQNGAQR
jgi:hypothetical protein